jgi:hypothetical protein
VGGRCGVDGVMEICFQEARKASAGMSSAIKLRSRLIIYPVLRLRTTDSRVTKNFQ